MELNASNVIHTGFPGNGTARLLGLGDGPIYRGTLKNVEDLVPRIAPTIEGQESIAKILQETGSELAAPHGRALMSR